MSEMEKMMETAGVPKEYVSPSWMSHAESVAFHTTQFPLAQPGLSVRAACFIGFLVRTTNLLDAYTLGKTRSYVRKEFKALLKAVRRKHCPQVSMTDMDLMAWSMFKRRMQGSVRVTDSETSAQRDLVWIWNQPTVSTGPKESKAEIRSRRLARYGEPIGMWIDITYAPDQPPEQHSLFTNTAGRKKLVKQYQEMRNSTKLGATVKPHIPRACGYCAKQDSLQLKFLRCPCKQASYCGRACQKKDWKGHKHRFHNQDLAKTQPKT